MGIDPRPAAQVSTKRAVSRNNNIANLHGCVIHRTLCTWRRRSPDRCITRSMFTQFAKLLGVSLHAAEDALHSENLAKQMLGRRGFMVGGLALLSSGVAYALPIKQELGTLVLTRYWNLTTPQEEIRLPVNLSRASVKASLGGCRPSCVDLYDALGTQSFRGE